MKTGKGKIRTEVDLKFFDERAKIEKEFTPSSEERYVYQVSSRGTKYVLKGFGIRLEHLDPKSKESADMFKESIVSINEVFQEYYLSQMASKFSPHFAAPLAMDFTIQLAKSMAEHSYMFIEIIFEYGGIGLNEMKSITLELAYNAMKQSADAMFQLHNSGIAHLSFKPANMLYDAEKDLLKVVSMGGAFSCPNYKKLSAPDKTLGEKIRTLTPEFAPPELISIMSGSDIHSKFELSVPAVDVYYWAMSFFALITNKTNAELSTYCKRYKARSEEDYKDFIKIVESGLDSIKAKNAKEENIKKIITNLLIKALAYKPKERPEMKYIKDTISKM